MFTRVLIYYKKKETNNKQTIQIDNKHTSIRKRGLKNLSLSHSNSLDMEWNRSREQ